VKTWQTELREGFRDLETLLHFLEIPAHWDLFDRSSTFPVRVPREFAMQMKKGDPRDPLLLQVLPLQKENLADPEFARDSVGDLNALKQKGLIQKYQGRVLLIMTGACAVHCRYCFRRHFPYQEQLVNNETKQDLLSTLRADQTIEEVIFSGGDPLLLTNESLRDWMLRLREIPQIKRWRIHTRLASMLPTRFDAELVEILQGFQDDERKTILVTHINHPAEIHPQVVRPMKSLQKSGITLLNQAVLLRDINDTVPILKELSEKLFNAGVLPYYLHLLDRTQGARHFLVPDDEAFAVYRQLSGVLPGYLLPKMVRETAGEPHKLILGH
jgi:EF-P beta-lysylation protein EpmB